MKKKIGLKIMKYKNLENLSNSLFVEVKHMKTLNDSFLKKTAAVYKRLHKILKRM